MITEVCAQCGRYRVTDTWAQCRDTGEQGLRSVTYRPADDPSLAWVGREGEEQHEVIDPEGQGAPRSRSIRNWAKHRGLIRVWGDGETIGWERAGDGRRVIETNGDPVWEDDEGFREAWEAESLVVDSDDSDDPEVLQ